MPLILAPAAGFATSELAAPAAPGPRGPRRDLATDARAARPVRLAPPCGSERACGLQPRGHRFRHPGSDGQTPSSPPRDASSIIHHGDFDFPQGHSLSHPLAALPARHRAAASDRRLACGAVGRARRDSRRPRGDARVAAAGARSPPRRHLSRRSRSARSVQLRRGRRTRALARFPSRLGSSAMRTFASTKVLGHLEHPEPTFQLDLCNGTKNFPLWRRCRTRSRVVPTHDTGVSPPYRAKTCLHREESC
jgi:hypothetical protein